jgi:predicted dehydrogenase
MSKIQAAVVGVGALGKHHARIYAELDHVELVAVVDQDVERAEQVATQYNCQAFSKVVSLPASLAVASLAVPTEVHCQIGCELLGNGIHLLVEKPIARTLPEADQLINQREKTGAVLQVGHTERFNPVVHAVLPFVTRPQFFEAHRLGVFVPRSLDVDVVLDLMIHDLDLILWLTGQEIEQIHAVGIPVLTPRVDIANARIEFKDGCVANVTASRVSRDRIRKLRFFQPHDYISLDLQEKSVEMYSVIDAAGQKTISERKPEIEPFEPLKREIQAFLAAVEGHPGKYSCSAQEGRNSLALALRILNQIA